MSEQYYSEATSQFLATLTTKTLYQIHNTLAAEIVEHRGNIPELRSGRQEHRLRTSHVVNGIIGQREWEADPTNAP